MSSNKITSYFSHNSTTFGILGTNPRTDTNNNTDGDSSCNIFSKCSKSTDKSSKLLSHKRGFSPNCNTGAKSVDHATDGTTTLLFFK